MSESHIDHKPVECTNRYCSLHRDIWRHYEDVIAPKQSNIRQMQHKPEAYCHSAEQKPLDTTGFRDIE